MLSVAGTLAQAPAHSTHYSGSGILRFRRRPLATLGGY